MPVVHLTLHAYKSWLPDDPRGYTRDGEILPSDPEMADRYGRQSNDDGVRFEAHDFWFLLSGVLDIGERRDWRVHAVFGEWSHLHFVVSRRGVLKIDTVRQMVPQLLAKFLGDRYDVRGRRWFARRPSCRRVRDRAHFDYLVGAYCDKHRYRWREGDPPPPALNTWLSNG